MNKKLIKKSWKIMKIEQKENNVNSPNNIQTSDVTIIDNEKQNNLEENEKITNLLTNLYIYIKPKLLKLLQISTSAQC